MINVLASTIKHIVTLSNNIIPLGKLWALDRRVFRSILMKTTQV
jgi:hypothetical protein